MSYGFSYFVFLISVYSSGEGAEGMLFSNGNGDISMWCRQTACFSNSELRVFYTTAVLPLQPCGGQIM